MKKKKVTINNRERDDLLKFEGKVVEAMPSTMFNVELKNGTIIKAKLAGRIKQNRIRVVPGDEVVVEVSVYDMTLGRITWRKNR